MHNVYVISYIATFILCSKIRCVYAITILFYSLKAVAFVSSSCLLIVLLAIGPLFEHLPRVSDLTMCIMVTCIMTHVISYIGSTIINHYCGTARNVHES